MSGDAAQRVAGAAPASLPYVVTAAVRQRLDLLHHLLEFGRQMVVLQGEAGSGRTRMLEAIVEEAGADWRVLQHSGEEVATPQRLLAALTAGLGLAQSSHLQASPLTRIREDLAQRQADGQVVVLAVDDAHALDSSCCALLYELSLGDEGSELHVMLVGDPQGGFAARLEELAPAAALVHIVDVPPLTEDAALDLYSHVADAMDADPGLPAADVLDLADACGGNPGQFIEAILALETPPAATPIPVVRERRPLQRKAMMIAALGLTGAIAGALIHSAGARRAPEPAVIEMTLPGPGAVRRTIGTVAPGTGTVQGIRIDAPALTAPAVGPDVQLAQAPQTAEAVVMPQESESEEAEPSAYAVVAADPGNEAELPPPPGTPAAVAPDPPATTATVEPTAASPASLPAANVAPPAAATPSSQPAAPPAPPVVVEAAPAVKPPAIADTARAPAPAPTPAKPTKSPPAKSATPEAARPQYDSKYVLAQPAQSFVVQLFGSREQEAAQRFVAAHGLSGRATVVRTQHSGHPWYIVSYGHYASRAEANRAAAALPGPLAALKPWPRAVSSLKQ